MASKEREIHGEEMMEVGTSAEKDGEKVLSSDAGEPSVGHTREEDVEKVLEVDKEREVTVQTEGERPQRLCAFPISRIKSLMKFDPDLGLANPESVFLIARAAEMFVELMAHNAFVFAQKAKRKTLQRKDLDSVIDTADEFAFLEGALD
uniref:DNA polymerase epsilon subunit 4 n=1 Tax=Myxine glutinosa TaxID=7769 RepID=UPI00358FA450